MADAFGRTKIKEPAYGGKRDFLPSFQYVDDQKVPVAVLSPPDDLFPDGFPCIQRHWVPIPKENGGKRWAVFMCTHGSEHTNGHCLACHSKQMGILPDADNGRADLNDEYVVPIFDMGKYRKTQQGKYILIDPTLAVDTSNSKDIIAGGLKALYVSPSQLRKIQDIHISLLNVCNKCNGSMQTTGMHCQVCDHEAYSLQQLAQLSADQVQAIRYNPYKCNECTCEENLVEKRICGTSDCGNTDSKSLFNAVIYATRAKVSTGKFDSQGKPVVKTEYSYNEAPQFARPEVPEEAVRQFMQKMADESIGGPTLMKQSEMLNIPLPIEWKNESTAQSGQQETRPYGS